jgi:23S rRNA pseudouridine1911/1915/1917 synthase
MAALSGKCEASPPETFTLAVTGEGAAGRLDQFLARQLGWSRARLQKLLKSGRVLVNGALRPASYRVREGDTVVVSVPEPAPVISPPKPCPWPFSLKTKTSWW